MINRMLTAILLSCLIHWRLPAQVPYHFSIVIDELFPDPSPSIGLPASEFIELKNVSSLSLNLRNWKISDGTSTATITLDFTLKPDSFVILCALSAMNDFTAYGNTIAVNNFPSLNNVADIITLYAPDGRIIHSLEYNETWYRNDIKKNGGWTLEMIDTKNPCAGFSNWQASLDSHGGTPGKKNSADGINKDELPPALIRSYTIDSTTIVAVFDEPVDSSGASMVSKYQIDNSIGNPLTALPTQPLFTEVVLKLSNKLSANTPYNLIINNVSDCAGNMVGAFNKAKAGLPEVPDSFDIVVNEILFNPKKDGYDYVEFYNRSHSIVDLSKLYAANRNSTGGISNTSQIAGTPWLLFPDEYFVITENKRWLSENYLVKNRQQVFELASLPSLPDDKGSILLANLQGRIMDELVYDHQWHFALIDNEEGIALERIDYSRSTQNRNNWSSAASTAGFGTPTFQNSQFKADLQAHGEIAITPRVFSPDNDGMDDLATINYQMAEPGYVANITIFDAQGRPVRSLAKNATLSQKGYFSWDGLDENRQKLPVGVYIIFTNIFNLTGKTKKFRNTVTLARKL